MKKFLLSIVFLFFVSFISLEPASAEEMLLVKSKETSNSIELHWNLQGKTYKVYRDQNLIYEGPERKYLDKSLEENHMYSYRIGTYDENNKLIEVTNYKTRTKTYEATAYSLSPLDKGDLSTKLSSTVGRDFVQLSWGYLEDSDGIYEIYRDEKLIGETDKLFFTDQDLESGKTYKYTVESKKDIPKQNKIEMENYIKENNLEVSKEEKEELFTESHVLMRLVETNEKTNETELQSKDLPSMMLDNEEKVKSMGEVSPFAIKYSLIFRYSTFIPGATAKPPLVTTYYKGDNRGFDFFSNKYRTRSDVFAGWSSGNELKMSPYTGVTTQVKNGVTTTKKASTNGMKITKDLVSSSKMMWRVNHNIGDPFAAYFPNINYYYEGALYNNYSFEVRGSHDKAPNHEFYFALAYTEDTPGTIFKYTGGSLFNLIPGAPQRYFEFSM
ncbi:hypothetical protein CSV80_14325 [Sporosarcina sp. P12(2017)]|uniref:hypothetical protein n=1 Tax=unclassified Sporosarcina TaxID=2647733 RepID=UPI000C162DF1|nr:MULTISPECIES: hypothetical protein [unclassified Sporosarcina]PIC56424.1 hypothetical protein CSV81_14190 [Sporosarcina sp. P10]PIC59721.1 hypothetical protein CSV80_14325 [Sporosarcina sp. P12(2017)]